MCVRARPTSVFLRRPAALASRRWKLTRLTTTLTSGTACGRWPGWLLALYYPPSPLRAVFDGGLLCELDRCMAWGESCQVKFDFYTKFLINMIGAVVVNMILLLLMYGHAIQPVVNAGCRCTCSQLALTHFAPPFCLAVHCQDAASKRVQSRGCKLSVTVVAEALTS